MSCANSTFAIIADAGGPPQARIARPAAPLNCRGLASGSATNGQRAGALTGDDPLAEFLGRLHFPGWSVGTLELATPLIQTTETPAIWFYVVVAGRMEVNVGAEHPAAMISRGDTAIVANESGHTLLPLAGDDADSADAVRILFGSFTAGINGGRQLAALLPTAPIVASDERTGLPCCERFVDWLSREAEANRPGSAAVVSRFLQSLLVEKLCCYLAAPKAQASGQSCGSTGPLQAALDPCLGAVLRLVHAMPERDWTVHSMARESGLSRSAFADRFRTLVGQPPLQYVTEIRMQKATELLETTDVPVKRIAALVGYESVSAFSSAFKRRFGGPPVSVRPKATGMAPLNRR